MAVISSSFSMDGPVQADGSRWCREKHNITGGGSVDYYYLTPAGFDPTAKMSARVATVNTQLADEEAEENFDRDGAPTLAAMTLAQFGTRIRRRYLGATREDACRLAYWLTRRIAAGHITDAQCRNAFGLTTVQWTNFKVSKLTPQHDAWAAVIAATGG